MSVLIEPDGSTSGAVSPVDADADSEPLGYVFPLAFAQQRLWFLEQLGVPDDLYVIQDAYRLIGPLDRGALHQAFLRLARRHESLRTTFDVVDGEPAQIVAEEPVVDFEIATLDQLGVTDLHPLRLSERLRSGFDLRCLPLFKVRLVDCGEHEHVLVFTIHHIITDGWSMQVLWRELGSLYTALVENDEANLPELLVQYADYTVWQRDHYEQQSMAVQLDYWRQRLQDLPAESTLPLDHPRPPEQSYGGAVYRQASPHELTHRLQELAVGKQCTLFMVLLAAFKVLLHRWSGDTDIVVGSPIAGRGQSEVEHVIGFFVNTLVLRTDLGGRLSFAEVLSRVKETALGGYDNQDVPLEKLVEALQPARDRSRSPLFQVFFVQNKRERLPDFSGLETEPLAMSGRSAKFDLSVYAVESGATLALHYEYNTDLYRDETIVRFAEQYLELLRAVVVDPDRPIAEIPLLDRVDAERLLRKYNATTTQFPRGETLVSLFAAAARQIPDAVALIAEESVLSFAELDERSERLAARLQARGVEKETLVGIALEPSTELVVALLATLKSGATYVPLDPDYPAARLRYMVEHSGLVTVLTRVRHRCLFDNLAVEIIDPSAEADVPSAPFVPVALGPEDRAYVLYTSGSTGLPKGVEGLHAGAVNRLRWQWASYPYRPGEVACHRTTLNFVDAVSEIFGPLLQGIPLLLVAQNVRQDPAAMLSLLGQHRVTRLLLVPTLLRAIVDLEPERRAAAHGIELWVSSGERLTSELAVRFFESFPGARLVNLYGASEFSGDSHYFEVDRERIGRSVPIGRPIANMRGYVLDEARRPVPEGVAGELYVGGEGLARGYWRDEAGVAERFVHDSALGERLFRTGDRVRFVEDGIVEWLGRSDDQIKIRGMRVELGEIEAALGRIPGVQQATLRIWPRGHEQRLAAYVVPVEGAAPSASQLAQALGEQLPGYMVPSAFTSLASLPLLPNGKIDRQSLPEPTWGAGRDAHEQTSPRTTLETSILEIWREALGVADIGVDDDFFELGGHSMLAVEVFTALERLLGRSLPLALLFEAPTVAGLAARLARREWRPSWSPLVAMSAGPGVGPTLLLVHPIGGNVLHYKDLVRRLADEVVIYGIQPVGLEGHEPPIDELEPMATRYVEELLEAGLPGPHILAGSSMGGTIAFEMAHQLRARGKAETRVWLFDTWGPGYLGRRYQKGVNEWLHRQVDRVAAHSINLAARSSSHRKAYVVETVRAARKKLARKLGAATKEVLPEALRRVRLANTRAINRYQPRTYGGDVVLFRAKRQPSGTSRDRSLGWGRLVDGRLTIRTIPGYHGECCVEPHVVGLVEAIRRELVDPGGGAEY